MEPLRRDARARARASKPRSDVDVTWRLDSERALRSRGPLAVPTPARCRPRGGSGGVGRSIVRSVISRSRMGRARPLRPISSWHSPRGARCNLHHAHDFTRRFDLLLGHASGAHGKLVSRTLSRRGLIMRAHSSRAASARPDSADASSSIPDKMPILHPSSRSDERCRRAGAGSFALGLVKQCERERDEFARGPNEPGPANRTERAIRQTTHVMRQHWNDSWNRHRRAKSSPAIAGHEGRSPR